MRSPERGIERMHDTGHRCTVRTCRDFADYWCWYEVKTSARSRGGMRKRAECERHAQQFAKKFNLTMPKG